MIKRVFALASVIALALFLVGPGLAEARGPEVVKTSVEPGFPLQLVFNLSAKSDVAITDIRLHYVVEEEGYANVTSEASVEFMPASMVSTRWSMDMKKVGGLPPGSGVQYWWEVEDINGDKTTTVPARVEFEDRRYPWRNLAERGVTIYWYEGGESFASEIMLAAQQALTRLAGDTGAYLKKPARIYVYANTQELQGALIFPQEWAGGVAFLEFGVIAIGISPEQLAWGKRAIAHELTHLVIHQMTFNPYGGLPTWLDEGLAMYAEGTLDSSFVTFLKGAIDSNGLISVRSLSSPFSAFAGESYLSYAQSYSLIEFLITRYGRAKMLELLNTFSQGSSYDEALVKVYGFDRDGLDAVWRAGITQSEQEPTARPEINVPLLAATSAAAATACLLLLSLAAERWAWRRGW